MVGKVGPRQLHKLIALSRCIRTLERKAFLKPPDVSPIGESVERILSEACALRNE